MTQYRTALSRTLVALLPLLISALAAWAVASGRMSLGAGEKDIILVFPLALWSIGFLTFSMVQWAKGTSLARASSVAALHSVVVLAVLFAAFVALTWR
jgi:hypothetical protein